MAARWPWAGGGREGKGNGDIVTEEFPHLKRRGSNRADGWVWRGLDLGWLEEGLGWYVPIWC